jgi:hypothetical protein
MTTESFADTEDPECVSEAFFPITTLLIDTPSANAPEPMIVCESPPAPGNEVPPPVGVVRVRFTGSELTTCMATVTRPGVS